MGLGGVWVGLGVRGGVGEGGGVGPGGPGGPWALALALFPSLLVSVRGSAKHYLH